MRYIIGIILALLLSTGALGWGLWQARGELGELRSTVSTQADDIEALRAAQARTAASLASLSARSQQSKVEVNRALDKDPGYRDAVPPAPITDELCKRIKCKR